MKESNEKPKKKGKSNESIVKKLTGLTLSEFLHLKKLKKELAGEGRPDPKQISTQQTISFEKMFPDGVCKVKKNYYTKMIGFDDVNYISLDDEEKSTVLESYAKLINSFDPAINVQLFFFNRKVGEKRCAEQFGISPQDDDFNDIREEFGTMLQDLSVSGCSGIRKDRYFILGLEADNLQAARDRFSGIEDGFVKSLSTIGSKARVLNGKERLEILYEFFNQDSKEPFRFSFKEMAESGTTVKDYIAPQGFEFRFPGRYKMGHMFGETKYFCADCAQLKDEFLQKLLAIDGNISVSVHMKTLEPAEGIKLLKKALSEIQKSKIDEQKKAVRAGYDMDILPTDIVLYERDTMDLLDSLSSSNQKLVWSTILISSFAPTKRELSIIRQEIGSVVQEANSSLIDLQYKQEDAMNSAAPIGINKTGAGRHLTTKNLAILIPFNTYELRQKGQALYYGLNAISGNLIMADRKNLRTPNGIILGTPGSGKSFSIKREILGVFLVTSDDIIICDPEGEYYPIVNALGGEVVKLSTSSTDYINPMDIQISSKDDREELKLKSDFIITLCDAIAGGKEGLENDEKGIIDSCIGKLYDGYFEDPKPENMPILEDLYNALLNYEPDRVVTEDLAKDAKRKAIRIANSLVLYVHGSQNYFNHRSTVNANNRIICFDIRDLGNQLKELGMLIVQDAVWNRVSANRERKISTRYYCDEFHLLLRDKQTAQYSVEIWKRFRKWGGIPTGITQNVKDFLKNPDIEGILGNSDFVYLLNQSPDDREILGEKFNLSRQQLEYVTGSGRGCGLIRYDNVVVPFVDDYPEDTKTYALMNTRPQEEEN